MKNVFQSFFSVFPCVIQTKKILWNNMNFCFNCGAPVTMSSATFCTHCGVRLRGDGGDDRRCFSLMEKIK